MAAEVPVTDVLCEAMEYLTKLGSNLRARSESLKEKRIRKDKLKNSHAVQKAADKVLLICELSKKSLENVECGVRKVLSLLKDNQMSPAKEARTSNFPLTCNEKEYQFITVMSRKVRIAKKVPVKHYMSVKVLARNMPKSLQDKYPVYHDCKLYRQRKKIEKKLASNVERERTKESSEESNKVVKDRTSEESNKVEKKRTKESSEESNKVVKDRTSEESNKVEKKRNKESSEESNKVVKDRTSEESNKVEKKRNKESSEESNKVEKKRTKESSEGSNKVVKDRTKESSEESYNVVKKRTKESSEERLVSKENNEKTTLEKDICNTTNLLPNEVEGNSENISVIEIGSNELTHKKSSASDNGSRDAEINIDSDSLEISINEGENTKQSKKKFKHIKFIDDSSENSNDTQVALLDSEDKSNTKRKEIENSKETNCNQQTSKNDEVKVSESSVHENTENDLVEKEVPESNRPLIKCVSIIKLLKPDILQKTDINSDILEKNDVTTQSTDKKKEKLKKHQKVNSIDKYLKRKSRDSVDKSKKCECEFLEQYSSSNEEEYWSIKRKEVGNFRSKKFRININRLPPITEIFLQSHNLKKITQNNNIICDIHKIENKTANGSVKEKSTIPEENEMPIEKINQVKNALLNESDSEKTDSNGKSPINVQEIVESVKTAIIDLSVDDHNSSELEKQKITENAEDSLVDEESNKKELHCDSDKSEKKDKNKKHFKDKKENSKDMHCFDSETDTNTKEDHIDNNTDKDGKVYKGKESLLNESDEDKNDKTVENKQKSKEDEDPSSIEKAKDILLVESGSDNNEESNNTTSKKSESTEFKDSNTKSPKQKDNLLESNENNDMNSNADGQLETTRSKKRKRKDSTPVKLKRKHIMESMHAKKMLLTYSSSDTEDEQLKDALKEIKDSLLKEKSSDDENAGNTKVSNESSATSESDDSILGKAKRVKKSNDDVSSKDHKKTDLAKAGPNNSEKSKESTDERSDSSSAKMGRSRAQPGGSSNNSDSQEANDKDIDGLTNLESLNRRRRRDSPTTDNTDSNSVNRKTRKMAKAPLISEENLLKADSSSASASGAESDGGEAEDLPPVTLSGLNGSGIDHLAKDDLLVDSDTSNSHNEKDEANKKSESDEDHNPKSKRRKANAISSDSEAGSSRKNKQNARVSDFEDSEEESSESANRNKRKKKANDSDASDGSSSNDSSKKKRRRIKQLNDSDDASGSDTENEGRNKHGRKNIRKVMGKNQLEEATKKAAREEKERIARIAERQKVYNNLEFDESGKPDEVVLEKVVLDFDPETKEPLIQLDRGLVKKLKPHQANGIKFMWDACFESVKRIKKDRGSGCILAHCMGLGKTLQVVSLTHTLLIHSELTKVNRVLVVCPLSTVLNWVNEFKMWLKYSETDYEVDVYELSRYKQNSERAFQLQQWLRHGGVCVLGYEMFRNLSADNSKKFKKKMLKNFQEALVDPGPDLVVCDEGHLLKNEKTSLSQSMNRVRTQRRIVLTGTPLQNNLKEYYCMVQFVKPNLLGKYNEYLNRFVNPITNGQYTDSTEHDIRIMKRRSHVLHKMLDGAVQRRDYGVLAPFLPPKHEYVLFITLSEVQIKLYQFYLDNYSRRPLPGKSSGFLFPDFQSLQRIWTHPLVLKYNSERYEILQQKKREREEEEDSEGSLVDFIDDDSTPDESSSDESSGDLSDVSDDSRKKSKKKKSQKKKAAKESKIATRRATRANPVELEEEEANNDVVEMKAENPTEWWIKLVTDDEIDDLRNSHKLVLLFDILRQCEAIGDKLLVFSQSLYSLDLIEHFLGKVDEATQEGRIDDKLAGHVGSWSPGIDYFRLDGSTSCENRSIWCKNFNREDNPRARLFLISTRAGGLGINLVAANRVVIFDVSWNPSHDVQSIFRVYRFGQKKPCYVYRFLAMGTMEEKIYERQVTKQAISKRVIDEQQIDRHYAENDLAELYKFDPVPPTPRPLPPLPKDRLFAEMLREHEAQIYKYHEHDSLLENKEEETLSEEERKAAWEDFENEKNRPPPAPFPQAWPMHNGMVPGLLAQQQQQLAYAALAAMLRKDMPNINDNTIRDMLPHIYNSNPAMFGGYDYGLMQKLSELYKYAPPGGMMNPGMINPGVMNAGTGGGAGGALGGSSGLQYEPPWQRQHQQQQQMRLQQLLQHQNQMGAKYYAGGLGSRDPVAMALQQQRAREIMAGEARGRPRGRPPLQPRAPAPHAGADVVNLDSD